MYEKHNEMSKKNEKQRAHSSYHHKENLFIRLLKNFDFGQAVQKCPDARRAKAEE
jgi:hypothetical protein